MAEPIRVLHLVNQLTVGGSERQMHSLVRAFNPTRVEARVAYLRKGTGELLAPLEEAGTMPEEYSLRGSLLQWNTLRQVQRIAARCRRERLTLIHSHDFWSNLIGVAAARLARIPIIISRRDLADFRPPRERRLLGLLGRVADATLVNAAAIGEVARRDGTSAAAIEWVPNGIDISNFDEASRHPLAAPLPPKREGTLRAVVIGNMDRPHKGHADIIEAAANLRDRPIDWLFLSDGPLRASLETLAGERGVEDRIHFVGRRREIPAILASVDLLVHASWSEGFPNVVLEALCARLPVVATDVGGTRDLIEHSKTGLLVAPRKHSELCAAIRRVLDDYAAAREWGLNGRALIEREFSIERATERVEAVYRRLLKLPAVSDRPIEDRLVA